MSTIIQVNNISKQYRLGQVGTGTISDDLNRWWHRVRGMEDPYLKIGEENHPTGKRSSDYAWALQKINFEVQAGEVMAIIGRNGAGKSTLLKILSRTTAPTTGQIKIKGRVASLLEVGTGFHPELSGRENIFLNGAILGMSRQEIESKFDEIVDFSGVEKYIDTPVKRYSSGMYVRLAFAVAAHLESEILIVDEVLAVGDAEFQKKCLGKMGEISQTRGRTILFVSHSMTSVQALCTNGLFLDKGRTNGVENLNTCVEKYLYGDDLKSSSAEYFGENVMHHTEMKNVVRVNTVIIRNSAMEVTSSFKTTEAINIEINWQNISGISCSPNFQLKNMMGMNVMIASDSPIDWDGHKKAATGTYVSYFKIPSNLLNANDYYLSVALDSHSPRICYESHSDVIKITVWDPMNETSIARGMFTSVREDVALWPALECSFKKIS